MLSLSNHEVWRTLREVAVAAYPERVRDIRPFDVEVQMIESRTRHGDYTWNRTGESFPRIRIFNLSRTTAEIIKTTVHELAHHLDVCFTGRTAHDEPFYSNYKHLLETAHRRRVIDLALIGDDIAVRDLAAMRMKVGAPEWSTQERRTGLIFKVERAFEHKDALHAVGYRYSPTEKLWILEVPAEQRAERERQCRSLAPTATLDIVGIDENKIESIYFGVLGKKIWGKNDELKAEGFNFHAKHGWYKRIKAADKDAFTRLCQAQFEVEPVFRGTLC